MFDRQIINDFRVLSIDRGSPQGEIQICGTGHGLVVRLVVRSASAREHTEPYQAISFDGKNRPEQDEIR